MIQRCTVSVVKKELKNKTVPKSTELLLKVQHVWQNYDRKISYISLLTYTRGGKKYVRGHLINQA